MLAAMRDLPGFLTNTLDRNDDASTEVVDLGFEVDFFGSRFDELFVNNNGNVTFLSPLEDYIPTELENLQLPIISPFWGDVDTRGTTSGIVSYGTDVVDGFEAFGVNWTDVGYFNQQTDLTNSFQLVLIDRSDAGAGAFDIEFNYDRIAWDTAEDAESDALPARAGFAASPLPGDHYELIGSGISDAFLDSNQTTGLITNSLNSDVLGRYRFEVRGGTPLNPLGLAGQAIDVGPGITYLGEGVPREFLLTDDIDNAVDTINAEQVFQNGGLGLNLSGAGITVGQWEGSVPRVTHQEFGGRVTINDGATNVANHPTSVAGVIASGGGFQAGIARGVANMVNVISNDSTNMIAEMGALAAQIIASNHSFGQIMGWDTMNFMGMVGNREAWFGDRTLGTEDIDFGKYTQIAVDLDTVTRQNPNLLSVWSAGNDRNDNYTDAAGDNRYAAMFSVAPAGTVTNLGGGWFLVPNAGATVAPGQDGGATGFDTLNPQKTAKNTLVVGAVNDVTVDPVSGVTITNFSNFGATDDGRIKPDVVANGADLTVPEAASDSDYNTGIDGTSFAAPGATGAVALLTQHFQTLFGSTPRSATNKGIVIHNAFDAGNVGPDYTFGWGLIDVAASAQFLTEAQNPVPGQTRRVIEDTLTNGVMDTVTVDVTSGAPLKVTLVWTDPAGAVNAAGLDDNTRVLVNDLDLSITGPDGTFMPWTLNPAAPNASAVRNARNALDNVEQVVIDTPATGTYTVRIGQTGALQGLAAQQYSLLISGRQIDPDQFEVNDTTATATVLGSVPAITLRDLSIHDENDVDFFKYTAHDTGKLIVRALFTDADGDLDLRIRDSSGDIIASSAGTVDNEELVIPVVAQQMYFVEVFGFAGAANLYELEIENFPAPPPTGVHLDPASDTGMMNNDNITSDTTPTFFIQTDVLEFVDVNQNGVVDGTEIDVLTAMEAAAGDMDGVAVEVTLVNTTTGTSTVGFADPLIAAIPEVYRFTPTAALTPGVYLVSARLKIFDGRQDPAGTPAPAMGRSTASPPLWITIDTGGANVAAMVSADMINSSDTGMSNTDNVTNKMSPAFNGIAPAGFKVRLYANGELVGQTVTGSDTSDVGRGAIGGIGGAPNDGLGLWEITSEPLADGGYNITLEVEDAAGNVTVVNPIFNPNVPDTDIVVDTLEPNTPLLDLLDDTGRHNNDNITKDNTPQVSMTTTDPNIALAQLLFTDNLKFRIFDRFQNSAQEVLIYDSAVDAAADAVMTAADMFTALTQLTRTLPVLTPVNPAIVGGALADGVHNLKLEVEDRAGNISHDFILQIVVDTVAPPTSFGLPDAASETDGLVASSDTGVVTMAMTFADRVTSDTTPSFWGRAEANAIVRAFFDVNNNGVIDLATDILIGQTVAVPYDGNDAYPDGFWEITSVLDLNEIDAVTRDGVRRILVTGEDVAGNPMPMNNTLPASDELQIFIDTQGPQIEGVFVADNRNYDLFDPKPSVDGPTPLVFALEIDVVDQPNRVDQAGTINDFLYEALKADIAANPGHYRVVGDHVGIIPIQTVTVVNNPRVDGQPATARITLTFVEPLPDDRFTLIIQDDLVDPANNRLDGEGNGVEPLDDPLFPTGDGVPGGDFAARFTVDSRPEIGSFVATDIDIDINGNFVWDPANAQIGNDATNVDISFTLPVQNMDGSIGLGGYNVHDLLFAGRFGRGGNLLIGDDAVFVIDVSGSTNDLFGGDPVGDLNDDDNFDSILDAEIAAFIALNQQLVDRGLGNSSKVSIVTFSSGSTLLDMDPMAAGMQFSTTPLADADGDGTRDVDQLLRGLTSSGGTNFEAGLQAAIDAINGAAIAPGDGNVIFLSDGMGGPNFEDEADTIRNGLNMNLRAFGVGPGASLNQLLMMDPDAVRFSNTNELLGVFGGMGAAGAISGFDTLAAFGNAAELGGVFRWIVDINHDGVVTLGTDILTLQPSLAAAGFNIAGAIPVAGNFDNNAANGDEIGLYNHGRWALDTDHDFVIEVGDDTFVTTQLLGHPFVGDFDGDGLDDLAVFNNNQFFFNLANDGFGDANDATFVWGFPGVLDRPVAADMDRDGIDDIGLWVPRTSASLPRPVAEWYFLLSDDFDQTARVTGTVVTLNHAFTPVPFGNDLYAEFGDERSLPIIGNFDPPVAPLAYNEPTAPHDDSQPLQTQHFATGDYDHSGTIDAADYNLWRATFGSTTDLRADGNADGVVNAADAILWRNASRASSVASTSGDYDNDHTADSRDYAIWTANFGAHSGAAMMADGNRDGVVNAADYVLWRNAAGASAQSAALSAVGFDFAVPATESAVAQGAAAVASEALSSQEDSEDSAAAAVFVASAAPVERLDRPALRRARELAFAVEPRDELLLVSRRASRPVSSFEEPVAGQDSTGDFASKAPLSTVAASTALTQWDAALELL